MSNWYFAVGVAGDLASPPKMANAGWFVGTSDEHTTLVVLVER